jgi:hypothetical protein
MQIIHLVKGKDVLHKVSAFNNESLEKTPSLSSSKAKNYIQHTGSVSWKRHCLILLYILALTFINKIMAQDSNDVLVKKNQFGIGVGASYIQTLDLQVSSKMFQGVRKNLHLDYTRNLKKGIFMTKLNVFLGNLSPKSSDLTFYAKESDIYGVETTESMTLEIAQMGFNLELGYMHNLKKLKDSKNAFYIGGSFEENLTFPPGFVHIGLINYGSLNAKVRLDYIIKNNKPLIFQLSLPVVSVVTRNPYSNSPVIPDKSAFATFFNGNNKIETINHFQNLRFSAKYPFLVTKRMAFDIAYEWSWLHYYKPQHLTQLSNQLSLCLTF